MNLEHRPDSGRNKTGSFVVVVGPDGVGKTEIARALTRLYGGPTGYFHFMPPRRGSLPAHPPDFSVPPPDKGPAQGSRFLGWLRLARNVVRFWLTYALVVRPSVRRGALVVGDRWAYGYVGQPRAVRFYGPPWLARLAVRLLPEPDLVANLVAPPDVIRTRKQELTFEEIESELRTWSQLPVQRLRPFESIGPPSEVAALILEHVGR